MFECEDVFITCENKPSLCKLNFIAVERRNKRGDRVHGPALANTGVNRFCDAYLRQGW